ncbi:hypothetical protein IKM56_01085 [Candidatus Saccharibacteria bacterium]|nr:hypothetical protein [Candidatus Saccharibacteria bacterium]
MSDKKKQKNENSNKRIASIILVILSAFLLFLDKILTASPNLYLFLAGVTIILLCLSFLPSLCGTSRTSACSSLVIASFLGYYMPFAFETMDDYLAIVLMIILVALARLLNIKLKREYVVRDSLVFPLVVCGVIFVHSLVSGAGISPVSEVIGILLGMSCLYVILLVASLPSFAKKK